MVEYIKYRGGYMQTGSKLIRAVWGEGVINQSLGKNIYQVVEFSSGSQNRIMVETTSGEYFITVFCKWFMSLVLSVKSEFQTLN